MTETAIPAPMESIETAPMPTPTATASTGDIIAEPMREAYRLHFQGVSFTDIAKQMGKCRQTIASWIQKQHDEAAKILEGKNSFNLLVDQLEKLRAIEQTASHKAATCRSERLAAQFMNTALRAIDSQTALLLDTGVMTREPTTIYQQVLQLKPADLVKQGDPERPKSREQLIEELVSMLEQSKRM